MDDAVVSFVEVDVRPDAGVAVSVFLHLLAQRAPRSKVAPAETGGIDEDFLSVLHNGIVHRDILAFGEEFVNHLLFLRRVVDGQQILEDARHGGLVHAERVDNRADVPDKDARVPEIAALLEIKFCRLAVRLFLEGIYAEHIVFARRGKAKVGLDVPVTRFGARGLNAEGHDSICFCGVFERLLNSFGEFLLIGHHVVARHYGDVCLGVAFLYLPTYVADTRSSVSPARLCENVLCGYLRQLLLHEVAVVGRSYYIYIVLRDDVAKAVGGEL